MDNLQVSASITIENRMGDNEPVVAQTSSSMGYPSAGYNSNDYPAAELAPATGDLPSSVASSEVVYALPNSSNTVDGNAYSIDPTISHGGLISQNNETRTTAGVNDAGGNPFSQEAFVSEATHAVGYESLNGNEAEVRNFAGACSSENGNVANIIGEPVVVQQFEDASAISTEEDRLWSIVMTNSLDFNAWTALIQETEKVAEENILKIRKVYDTFLAEFPLCYGYWKKYADHEARLGTIEKVVEVYERAVQAVTYSVDIWLHYCIFAIATYGDPDTVRRLFERGLAYVGTDYLSYPLWDKYIEYEYSQQEWRHLAMIYTRILENPIQQLDRYFNSFKELAGSRPLAELQTAEEVVPVTRVQETGSEVNPDGVEGPLNPVTVVSKEAVEMEKYVAIREEMYKKAKEFDCKIIDFETAIRRPYFHVKPLDDAQLDNWHRYLDFIEGGEDFNKVIKLYERCLIACANYPEYWIRYVLCMEASGSMELANNALARATQVFVKRQPEIHIFAARFKEHSGDVSGARAEYQLVYSELSPSLLEAIIKHANMEYRLGNLETAFSVYEEAIAAEQRKEHSHVLSMLFVQYSRFLYLVAGNSEKARDILTGALGHVPLSKPLLEALIHLESIQSPPKRIDYLDTLVEQFITPNVENPNLISVNEREELSSIFLEFLDLFGDGPSIKKADNRHAKLFLHQKSMSESKKRHAEDFLVSDKTKLAKSYSSAPSQTQSVMGAYPNVPNQWTTGYGSQPQAWTQASQTQGQQWNPGYAQQTGYGGYAAYGGYANMASVVPQTAVAAAATATYPPPYPPAQQAFPQQNYAQAAPASVQTVVPAPQAYYSGSYY